MSDKIIADAYCGIDAHTRFVEGIRREAPANSSATRAHAACRRRELRRREQCVPEGDEHVVDLSDGAFVESEDLDAEGRAAISARHCTQQVAGEGVDVEIVVEVTLS